MATSALGYILSQTHTDPGDGLLRMLPWLGLIFVLVLVGGVVVLVIRNRTQRQVDEPEPAGFTLADLRTLRDKGELSDAEYEAAKAKMLAKVKTSLDSRTAELRQKKGKGGKPESMEEAGGEEAESA